MRDDQFGELRCEKALQPPDASQFLDLFGDPRLESAIELRDLPPRSAPTSPRQSFTEPDDFVFITDEGKPARTLYYSLIERLLMEAKLQLAFSGSRRSTYCFRHTYATFRLTEGVDVYFLAKQMGASVKMIEDSGQECITHPGDDHQIFVAPHHGRRSPEG